MLRFPAVAGPVEVADPCFEEHRGIAGVLIERIPYRGVAFLCFVESYKRFAASRNTGKLRFPASRNTGKLYGSLLQGIPGSYGSLLQGIQGNYGLLLQEIQGSYTIRCFKQGIQGNYGLMLQGIQGAYGSLLKEYRTRRIMVTCSKEYIQPHGVYTVKFHLVTIKHVVMFFKFQFSYQQLVFILKIVQTLVTISQSYPAI